jgi:predicted transcriptional regulator
MTRLQNLKQFKQLFINTNKSLDNYNNNLRNELFEIEPNENYQHAYKRGETIFDKCEDNLRNLNEIIEQQDEINKFFEKCKQNKIKLIKQKNEIINKLLRIKKNDKNITKEHYLNLSTNIGSDFIYNVQTLINDKFIKASNVGYICLKFFCRLAAGLYLFSFLR